LTSNSNQSDQNKISHFLPFSDISHCRRYEEIPLQVTLRVSLCTIQWKWW